MPPRKLVLFDIDGTLLTTNGRGRAAFHAAIEETFGKPFDASGMAFAGKTDPQILDEILTAMGVPAVPGDRTWSRILGLYCDMVQTQLATADVTTLPGVRDLLGELSSLSFVQLGLLTGNLEPTAYVKLRLGELDDHFPFGAFGSDDADRYRLPSIAVDRALRHTGHSFQGKDVIIVGDTEHDICCGKSMSATSVAVCTGSFSRDDLERFEPDVLMDDLAQPAAFIRDVIYA